MIFSFYLVWELVFFSGLGFANVFFIGVFCSQFAASFLSLFPQAEDFRAFWGKKSELRRFQDSSILEAVVWPAKTAAERRTIPARVSSHVLQRYAAVPDVSFFKSIH